MRTLVRWALRGLGLAALVVAGLALWFVSKYPAVPAAADLRIESTPERLERGRYLATHVTVCLDCHSRRDWSHFAGPLEPGSIGGGGDPFGREMGLPGTITPPNITPAALRGWTDGEIARAVTEGVSRDGRALFPMMPYPLYAKLDPEDLRSIIVFLRSLPAVDRATPPRELDFPLNLLVRTMPRAAESVPAPDRADQIAYGRYLTTIAGCVECHTPIDEHHERIESRLFAGGQEFPMPNGKVVASRNLTPHPKDGLGEIDRDDFIGMFRGYSGGSPAIAPDAPNTPMPWTLFAGMSDEDLGAIHAYLQSLPAIPSR